MAKSRVLRAVGIAVAAIALFGLVLLRPWWAELAPEIAELPLGLLSLALGFAVAVWLPRRPNLGGQSHVRRPRRLRNRVSRRDGTP